MKIPFVGPSYAMEAVSFDCQRSINLFTIISETGTSKSQTSLMRAPGLNRLTTVTGGPIRNAIASTSGRAFVVSAQYFIEISASGVETIWGSLNTQSARVCIAENDSQIMVVDGVDGWIFNQTTNVWAQITDVNFPVTGYVTYQDGYFIVPESGTQNFWISALGNGLAWDALDFTTVESSPDDLVAVFSNQGNLWCFGNRSIEVYQNTGASAFPFSRIPGAIIQTGCEAPFTIQKFAGSIAWLGTDEQGQGVVWMADGYQTNRISTAAMERRIASITNFSTAWAFVYHEQGHLFYCLQIEGLDTTMCYDASTQQWHERMYKNPETNEMELHRASCSFFFQKKTYVGDRVNGNIYEMKLNLFDDAGDPMICRRISPHQQGEKELLAYASFELDIETAVGAASVSDPDTGDVDPQIFLRYSDDGGHTWSSEVWRSMGKVGDYKKRAIWRQLGRARDRVFEVGWSAPVFQQINEAFINAT